MATMREKAADTLTGGALSEARRERRELREERRKLDFELNRLEESVGRLEAELYSDEWRRLAIESRELFSRDGIHRAIELARIMRVVNPVIYRGVEVQRLYVFAQGMDIQARDDNIQEAVQEFLDDERNRAEMTTHQARGEKEVDLQTDGSLYFRFFINEQTGRIRVRSIEPLEIEKIISNPEDSKEPWFYVRNYTQQDLDGKTETVREAYPDWRYRPTLRRDTVHDVSVNWDTPVYHVQTNKGLPEFYAALAWARSYKSFLEQLATTWKALARWAWKLNTRGKGSVSGAKSKLGTTLDSDSEETNPPPTTGSIWIQREDAGDLEPFKTSGATLKAEDGRRFLLMSAQVFGWPETFFGDASVGSLATAKSLDRPTELKIKDRQELWKDIYGNILDFVVLWAVKAPEGLLRGSGKVEKTKDGDEIVEAVEWGSGVDPTVVAEFPPIVEEDIQQQIGAVVDAATLKGSADAGTIPPKTLAHRLLTVLGFEDIDAILDEWEKQQEEREKRRQEMMQNMQNGSGEEDEDDDEGGQEEPREEPQEPEIEAAEALTRVSYSVRRAMTAIEEASNNGR